MIHPDLGLIVTVSALALVFIAYLNQRLTATHYSRASNYATRANLQADAMARNAQVMNAMGMIPEGVVMWAEKQLSH